MTRTLETPRIVRWGPVAVDLGRGSVLRDGTEVRLSPTEYLLIAQQGLIKAPDAKA